VSVWPIDDPSPVEDLDCDVRFGVWLDGLTWEQVARDLLPHLSKEEQLRFNYMKLRGVGLHHVSVPQTPSGNPAAGSARKDATP
jgi:hypothetical protein